MTEPRFTKRQMKRLILQTHARDQPGRHVHKMTVIGRSYSEGHLEDQVGSMSLEERVLAGRAYDELRWDGLIAPSYNDLVDPDNWCWITEQGRALLDRDCLDELDVALKRINAELIEMRDGAHDRARGHGPDAPRQAAHSARELLLIDLYISNVLFSRWGERTCDRKAARVS